MSVGVHLSGNADQCARFESLWKSIWLSNVTRRSRWPISVFRSSFLFCFFLYLFLSDMRSPIWPIGGTTALSVPSIPWAIKIRSKFSWGLSRDRASNCTRIRRCTCAVEQVDVVEFQISHFLFVFSPFVSLLFSFFKRFA